MMHGNLPPPVATNLAVFLSPFSFVSKKLAGSCLASTTTTKSTRIPVERENGRCVVENNETGHKTKGEFVFACRTARDLIRHPDRPYMDFQTDFGETRDNFCFVSFFFLVSDDRVKLTRRGQPVVLRAKGPFPVVVVSLAFS